MGVVVEKKAKVRDSHRTAIQHYRKWCERNPDATKEERIKSFNFMIDSAALSRRLPSE